MTNTNINFIRERNGYNREQVDSYILKLSEAYQMASKEYLDLKNRYDGLMEDSKRKIHQEKPGMNSDIIAKTLINAETLAQQIISDANNSAANAMSDAKKETESARAEAAAAKEAAQALLRTAKAEASKANEAAQAIIREAHAKASKANDTAQEIINDANTEAVLIVAQARKNVEQARKTMEKATGEVEKLLTFQVRDREDINSYN